MTKPTIYLETTVVGHIAARQQSDITVAARQLASLTWWDRRSEFDLFVSQIVLDECRSGDSGAAIERLELVRGITILDVTPQADDLAAALISGHGIPVTEPRDALHISIAATRWSTILIDLELSPYCESLHSESNQSCLSRLRFCSADNLQPRRIFGNLIMITDSINDEILRIKHELAALHGNDVRRIAADARARQQNAVTLPPRTIMSEPSDRDRGPIARDPSQNT